MNQYTYCPTCNEHTLASEGSCAHCALPFTQEEKAMDNTGILLASFVTSPEKIEPCNIEDPLDVAENRRKMQSSLKCTCEEYHCEGFIGHYSDCSLYHKPYEGLK